MTDNQIIQLYWDRNEQAKMKDFFFDDRVAMVYFPTDAKTIGNGNVLFEPMMSREVAARRGDQDVGVVPFPKYDTAQTDYVSPYVSGYMGIFADEDNRRMCGETAELLAFCSKDISQHYSREYLGLGSGQLTATQQRDLYMLAMVHNATTDLAWLRPICMKSTNLCPKMVHSKSRLRNQFWLRIRS